MTGIIYERYIKLKADKNLVSPVCSESVESLMQRYILFLNMQDSPVGAGE